MQRLTIGRPALVAAVLPTAARVPDHSVAVLPDPITVSRTALPPAVLGSPRSGPVETSEGPARFPRTVDSRAIVSNARLQQMRQTLDHHGAAGAATST